MSKIVKEMIAADMRRRIGDTKDLLVVDSSRLTGVANNNLRLKLRTQNIFMMSVKNSLASKTLVEMGFPAVDKLLAGPSVLVWGGPDIVALSKEITKWVGELKKLEIKGGVLDGNSISAKDVDDISKGPSREELIGRIVMLALTPGAKVAGALLGPGGLLAGQVKSIADKEPEAAPAAAS